MPFLRGTRYALLGSASFSPLSLSGLLAWWRLDDGQGTTAVDSSGNGYDLTLINTPTWIAGQKAGALNFVAASSQQGGTTAAGLLDSLEGISELTISFLARCAAYVVNNTNVNIRNGADTNALLGIHAFRSSNGNGVEVFWNGASIIDQNTGAATVDEWHHFVFVSRSATDHEMFVDNVSVGTSSTSKTNAATLSNVNIAAYNDSFYFNGDMDEVMIFDRALDAGELAQLYNWTGV